MTIHDTKPLEVPGRDRWRATPEAPLDTTERCNRPRNELNAERPEPMSIALDGA